jgi:hypothetical protein
MGMNVFKTLLLITAFTAGPLTAGANSPSAPASAQTSRSAEAAVIYNRHGQPMTAVQVGKAQAAELAVSKAGVAPNSTEAAMIRIGMGQPQVTAYEPFAGIYDAEGNKIDNRDAAEDLAIVEMMRRGGVEPGSERDEMIRAAAHGNPQTAEGEPVDEQTMAEVAKEVAVQEAILRTGVQPGSPNESLIRMGADVMMEKYRAWRE